MSREYPPSFKMDNILDEVSSFNHVLSNASNKTVTCPWLQLQRSNVVARSTINAVKVVQLVDREEYDRIKMKVWFYVSRMAPRVGKCWDRRLVGRGWLKGLAK